MKHQHQRPNPETDPHRPPAIPVEVICLQCQQEYESYRLEWRERHNSSGITGSWCCPTTGCTGRGFGLDILPIESDDADAGVDADALDDEMLEEPIDQVLFEAADHVLHDTDVDEADMDELGPPIQLGDEDEQDWLDTRRRPERDQDD